MGMTTIDDPHSPIPTSTLQPTLLSNVSVLVMVVTISHSFSLVQPSAAVSRSAMAESIVQTAPCLRSSMP